MYKIRIPALLIAIALVFGCGNNAQESVIEGVWKSDREMTIVNLDDNDKLTPERREFLEKNLGKLYISFRGNETRVFFDDIPENEVESQRFEIKSNTESSIEIKLYRSIFESDIFKYYRSGDCLYLIQEEWGYNEYFCKHSNT